MAKKKKMKYTKGILLSTYKKEDKWKILLSDFFASLAEGLVFYMLVGFLFTKDFTKDGIMLFKFYDYISYVFSYFLIFKTSRRLYEVGDKKERVKVILKLTALALGIVMLLTLIYFIFKIPMEFGVNMNWWMLSLIMVFGFAGSAIIKQRI